MAFATAGAAHADCGKLYKVQRGDTLMSITRAHLGHENYRAVYAANSAVLASPAVIEVGQQIYLPCKEETAAAARARALRMLVHAKTAPTSAGVDTDAAEGAPVVKVRFTPGGGDDTGTGGQERSLPAPASRYGGTVRILGATSIAPLLGKALPDDGIGAVILRQALARGGVEQVPSVTFRDRLDAPQAAELPRANHEIGFPWAMPACTARGISSVTRTLCRNYVISKPVYEVRIVHLVRAGDKMARTGSFGSLKGRTVCRPNGLPPIDLEAMDIDFRVIANRTLEQCAQLLKQGAADVISLPADLARRALRDQKVGAGLVAAPGLDRSVSVHAVALRRSAAGRDVIERLDQGLERMKFSKAWQRVVADYLERHDRARR